MLRMNLASRIDTLRLFRRSSGGAGGASAWRLAETGSAP